jgi:hypothetical protein
MGIINGGPFGGMINKTGNLVFRKVKRQNVVTIYVPNPRDPKSVQQLYYRSIIQRIGSEMSTGLANVAATLFREKTGDERPVLKMASKTALKYNTGDLPAVMYPQFGNGRLTKDIASEFNYNPFFDCLSFTLQHNNSIESGKLPLMLVIGVNRFTGLWNVLPESVCMVDGFQGNCYEGGQIGENTWEVVTYANYLYNGVSFWLELDVEQGIVNNNNYNNDINPNFMPATLKLSSEYSDLPVIVATDQNLKELRNYVPGYGYTNKMRKNTLFTPTMLNKCSGSVINHNPAFEFQTKIFDNIEFNKFIKLSESINNNNLIPKWSVNTLLYLHDINYDAVETALGTSDITYNFYLLIPTDEHTYVQSKTSAIRGSVPDTIEVKSGTTVLPVSVMVTYTNNSTGTEYLDFIKHWFNPVAPVPLSQLEYYYNQIPQRWKTPGSNPGMWLVLNKNVSGDVSRAAGFSIELFFAGTIDTVVFETDDLGNVVHEFNTEEVEIAGRGFDKNHVVKIKAGYNGSYKEYTVDILISGNCYSYFGTYEMAIEP